MRRCWSPFFFFFLFCFFVPVQEEGQQQVTMEDLAYEKALDSMAMVAGHMPLPLFRALLTWRQRSAQAPPSLLPGFLLCPCPSSAPCSPGARGQPRPPLPPPWVSSVPLPLFRALLTWRQRSAQAPAPPPAVLSLNKIAVSVLVAIQGMRLLVSNAIEASG